MKNIIKKSLILFSIIFVFMMRTPFINAVAAESDEEWVESGTITLDKVTYDTKTRKMTVEITESSGNLAHEYELYMFVEGELENSMGQFLNLNRILSILGIMTVDVNDKTKISEKGKGVIVIADQEMYFGNNEAVAPGTKVIIGVESYDEEWNASKSNLIEMDLVEGTNEKGAISTQGGNSKPSSGNTESENSGGGSGLLIGASAGLLASGGGVYAWSWSKKRKAKDLKKVKKQLEKERPSLQVEDKSVVISSKNEKLIKALKARPYLAVKTCEMDAIEEAIEENEPNILICDLNSEEQLDELLAKKDEKFAKVPLGLNVSDDLLPTIKARLESLKDDKTVAGFVPFSAETYEALVRLILPILKPDLKSDESLSNIGQIADLLGIPGISTAIDLYTTGRDIKNNLEESELGVSQGAAIIGDIASIMGLDKVASIAGLVDSVDSIKSALDKDAGANEAKWAISAGKDIVDVVKDLSDK